MEPLTAGWLASRRDELNHRFTRAKRRWPGLRAEAALGTLAQVLPPLAGAEPAAGDLLSAVYDLVLLHAGRGTDAHPGISTLLRTTLPALRGVLLTRPSALPAALSNAVENLGERGQAYALAMATLAFASADDLLAAGAVVAWRVGHAPLRRAALEHGAMLPAPVLSAALGVEDGPATLRALAADAWRLPGRGAAPGLRAGWEVSGLAGDFAGFGGCFDRPPTVLEGGDLHVIYARTGDRDWRIDADVFGATCRAEPASARGVSVPARRGILAIFQASADRVEPDGTLVIGGIRTAIPSFAGASACSVVDGRVAVSHPDSHRIRIATRPPA